MRSLKFLPALLPILNAYAARPEADTTVIVTTTRTVTICPITELFTCEADLLPSTTYIATTSGSLSTTKSGGGNGTYSTSKTGEHDGSSTTTRTYTTTSTGLHTTVTLTTTSTGIDNGPSNTKTGVYNSSSTTTGTYTTTSTGKDTTATLTTTSTGITTFPVTNGTMTATGSTSTTTGKGNSTTTFGSGNSTSTTGSGNSTTTTSSCNGTTTATGISQPLCNSANSRSSWCLGKNVDSDTHDTFFTGQTKKYSLTITDAQINFDGTPFPAFAINGKTPGEPIIANWGDFVEITVTNGLKNNATTIHWHGIRQFGTNDQDGVPGVTECGIAPGSSRVYKWHASTYGTGWYHSHALAQYGGGIRGPIIIHGPATSDYDVDMGTVMIDEKFSQTIFQMAYNIARVRGALPPATNYLLNGKNKVADGSAGENQKWTVKKGKKHMFRIINSSAQSGYAVHFDNHKMTVVSADFTPVVPYETDTLFIMSGQRYNVIVEMNQPQGAYYLRAVTQTGCGTQCVNNGLGTSNGIFEYEGSCGATPAVGNYTLTTAGICKDEFASLKPKVSRTGGSPSEFSSTVKLLPGGNAAGQNFDGYGAVNRWYLGGVQDFSKQSGTIRGDKTINVTYDQPTLKTLATVPDLAYNSSVYSNAVVVDGTADHWVYFVIQNNFQTSHPMHLHGHDFSILGYGSGVFTADMVGQLNFANPIRRDTALLTGYGSPTAFTSGWTVIGFQTDNPGAWVMHCHIIWHADGGMGLQYLERPSEIPAVKYASSQSFKDECSAYENYEDAGGELKAPYESGLKFKRHLADHQFHGYSHGAVRYS